MTRLSTRQWRDEDRIILTGKPNPYRPGCGAHDRTNHVIDAGHRNLTKGEYWREFVETGLTRDTTLRTCVRNGIVQPVTDQAPVPVVRVANAATDATTRAIWIGIREIGEQITRLADENLRAA
jgi:hypothetical protein